MKAYLDDTTILYFISCGGSTSDAMSSFNKQSNSGI